MLFDPDNSPQATGITETHVIAEQEVTGNGVCTTCTRDHYFVVLSAEPALDAPEVESNRVIAKAL